MSDEFALPDPGPVPEGAVPAPPEPQRVPFWGYADLFLVAGLAAPCMLAGFGLVKLAIALLHWHAAAPAEESVPETLIGYALLFGALTVILRVQYHRPFWRSLGWNSTRIPFLWNVIAGLASALAVGFVGHWIATPPTSGPIMEMMKGPEASLVVVTLFGTVVAPMCEELAFRGFLQPLLVRSFGAVAGILMAAAPFGMLHYWEYGDSWRSAVQIGLAGATFGWMRQATGSTRAAAIMHASFNALSFVSMFMQGRNLPH
jgi:membrane protease YdiL (CAAX protease family)